MSHPIRIGISSCLLGEAVRFDANHKKDNYIVGTLGQFFEFVPTCPEVAIGLGIPRAPIRLEGDPQAPRVVGSADRSRDVTAPLTAYGRQMAQQLPALCGYLFKSKSPSCGVWRVKVYQENGRPAKLGRGVFAQQLMEGRPLLPVEEEGRLGDPALRENFIERVFAYHRWQQLLAEGFTPARLVAFHSAHKLSLMSHGNAPYRALGRLVAEAGQRPSAELAEEYGRGFMAALTHLASRKRHTDVLQHIAGYFKRQLDGADRTELAETIEAYRTQLVPLVVPLTLLKHHLRRHPNPYLEQQIYLQPHPPELTLRNAL